MNLPPLILLIENDPLLRADLADVLTSRGFSTLQACDGQEGLELLALHEPALIVLSYWMPRLDGAGFLRGMAQLVSRRPPVILLTNSEDDRRLVRDLGVDVQLEKRDLPRRFVKLVEATLRGGERMERIRDLIDNPRDRRAHERRPLRRAVEVRSGTMTTPVMVESMDWSEGGVCLVLEDLTKIGTYLAVTVALPDGRQIELDARVRYAGAGKIGAEFLELDPQRRGAIDLLLGSN